MAKHRSRTKKSRLSGRLFLLHAVVMWMLAVNKCRLCAWWLFGLGIVFFSGSLYLLATMQWKWLGPVTPVGGVLFIAGWATLMIQKPKA